MLSVHLECRRAILSLILTGWSSLYEMVSKTVNLLSKIISPLNMRGIVHLHLHSNVNNFLMKRNYFLVHDIELIVNVIPLQI